MSVLFSPPAAFNGSTEEQLKSMQSWLFQFTEQLQHTLNNLDASNFSDGAIEQITNTQSSSNSGSNSSSNSGGKEEFDYLKSLIIKTAHTIDSYYEEITETLKSDYLAVSDFGQYSENNNMTLVKNALGVTQAFTRLESVEKIADSVETSFNTYVEKTNAYIRTGYLEQLDAYGVAVGEQKVEVIDGNEVVSFNQFATWTASELAFWQNGVKLGYFQGDSLFVNGTIRVGGWAIDTQSGFTIKYA